MELGRGKALVVAGIRDAQLLPELWRRNDVGPRDPAQLLIAVNLRERFRRPVVKAGYPSAKLRILLRVDLVHPSARQIDDLAGAGTVIPGSSVCAGRIQRDDLTAVAELVAADLADVVQTISLLRTMTLQQALRAEIEARIALRNAETSTELDRGRRDDVRRLRKGNEFRLLRQLQGVLRIGAVGVLVIERLVPERRILMHLIIPGVGLPQESE